MYQLQGKTIPHLSFRTSTTPRLRWAGPMRNLAGFV